MILQQNDGTTAEVTVEDLTESVDKIKIETTTEGSTSDGNRTDVTVENITKNDEKIEVEPAIEDSANDGTTTVATVEDLIENVDKIKVETTTEDSASSGTTTEVIVNKITENVHKIKVDTATEDSVTDGTTTEATVEKIAENVDKVEIETTTENRKGIESEDDITTFKTTTKSATEIENNLTTSITTESKIEKEENIEEKENTTSVKETTEVENKETDEHGGDGETDYGTETVKEISEKDSNAAPEENMIPTEGATTIIPPSNRSELVDDVNISKIVTYKPFPANYEHQDEFEDFAGVAAFYNITLKFCTPTHCATIFVETAATLGNEVPNDTISIQAISGLVPNLIPKSVTNLPHLEHLSLNGVGIEIIEMNGFDRLPNLRNLSPQPGRAALGEQLHRRHRRLRVR
ncbi:hypothetical protein GEV33_001120 [Tenebrio molitor]|uniref:Uncharacterized protein n=1 Tax=Tenebrio molitor TaxID=7067 RepID=A0A8J6HTN9_TENMO|nr:hypothetical protein GEV33_001120 [Tenebrio molitor]